MPRRTQRRRFMEYDDSEIEEGEIVEDEDERLAAMAALAIYDLGNFSRDRVTAHDREHDREINQEAIHRQRRCNLSGSAEAKEALQHQPKLTAWHSVTPVAGEAVQDAIADGQYHRERIAREIRVEAARFNDQGIDVNAENVDLKHIHYNSRPRNPQGFGNRPGLPVEKQPLLQRKPHNLPVNRPLDPAVDPDREYTYKGKGGNYVREDAATSGRSRSVQHDDTRAPLSESSRGSREKAVPAQSQRSQRLYNTVSMADPQDFLKRLRARDLEKSKFADAPMVNVDAHSVMNTPKSSGPGPLTQLSPVANLTAMSPTVPSSSDPEKGPKNTSTAKEPSFEVAKFREKLNKDLKAKGNTAMAEAKKPTVNPFVRDKSLNSSSVHPDKNDSQIKLARPGLRPPNPSVSRENNTDGKLTPVNMSEVSFSPVKESKTSEEPTPTQSRSVVTDTESSTASLLDETVPPRVAVVQALSPEKPASPRFIEGRWYIPAPKGFDPEAGLFRNSAVITDAVQSTISDQQSQTKAHLDHSTSKAVSSEVTKSSSALPGRPSEAEQGRNLSMDEILVLATRSKQPWVRPEKLSDLSAEQKAIIAADCHITMHRSPTKIEPLTVVDGNVGTVLKSKILRSKWADDSLHSKDTPRGPSAAVRFSGTLLGERIVRPREPATRVVADQEFAGHPKESKARGNKQSSLVSGTSSKLLGTEVISRDCDVDGSAVEPSSEHPLSSMQLGKAMPTDTTTTSVPTGTGLEFRFKHVRCPSDSDDSEL